MQTTLAIIKPDAVRLGHVGHIITRIEESGLDIVFICKTTMMPLQASAFYAEHKNQPYCFRLIEFMSIDPLIIMRLQAEDAVVRWRAIMGATDPR